TAAEGARQAIARAGFRVEIHRPPFRGTVTQVVSEVTVVIDDHWRNRWITDPSGDVLVTPTPRQPVYHVWTGEATLELPRDHGHGGRAQQMALMLSRELARMEVADPATVLVAGTDGRDGPTDAAGAVVDGDTAGRIAALGIDIDAAITRADSYPALEAVGALLRTGSTGTNVADIVIAEGWSWY